MANATDCLADDGDSPWLSVVMPVHDGAQYLDETLASLVGEADAGVEVIIIDSSVNDRCARIVEQYRDRLTIDYLQRPDMVSWTSKTNFAVTRSSAGHISMLHQDDLWLSGRADAIRAALSQNPAATMLLFPSRFIDRTGRDLGRWTLPLSADRAWGGASLIECLLVQNFVAICAPVIARADWAAVGGLDEDLWYTPDWDLYIKLAGKGDAVVSDRETTAFRVHRESQTVKGSRDSVSFQDQQQRVIDRYVPTLPPDRRARTLKIARASMAVNVALAAAAAGRPSALFTALTGVARLNPRQFGTYLRYSRIFERVVPRLRTLFVGSSR